MTNAGLRFVMLTTFYPPYHFGGDANYVRQLAHILVKRGHQVDIIHDIDAYQMLSDNKHPAPVKEPQGLNVYGLSSKFGKLSCLLTQQFGYPVIHAKQIKAILNERKPDVIHFHNASLVAGPGGLQLGDAIKLYTAHEHWLVCPTHVLWRHNREVCTERQCFRCIVNYRRPPQLWRKTGLLARKGKHIDQFFALSHFSAEKHNAYGFPFDMQVLPSFIPDNSETKQNADSQGQQPYFLIVGRLEKIKGIHNVIPLFTENKTAELWIAGTGEFEQQLRAVAKDADNIKFLGQISQDKLKSLYAGAIAVITPSICYEVFPLVVLEAFREKTPIIANNLGPYPEIINKSHGGMLFSNSSELKDAISQISSDMTLRNKLGMNGFQTYQSTWSESASMTEYFKTIKKHAQLKNRMTTLSLLKNCTDDGYVNEDNT